MPLRNPKRTLTHPISSAHAPGVPLFSWHALAYTTPHQRKSWFLVQELQMTDILEKNKSKGILARIKKPNRRSLPESKTAIESEIARTTVPAIASTPTVPAPFGTDNVDISTGPKRTRRQEAEDELKAAAGILNKAMSRVSERIPVPEALTLEHIDHVDDVEGTAREIANTIDIFIAERRPDMTLHSKAVWKGCLKRWYSAAYPYVKPCLNAVNVTIPLRFYWMR